ncbi:flagellar motor protein [Peptococcaceae bacterium]|nr:flagellar motor protein [Peptococcaceae bacterium]
MNIMMPLGIFIATASLVVGFMIVGGSIGMLIMPAAMLIVIGGTFGATMSAYSMEEVKTLPKLFAMVITRKTPPYTEVIDQIVELADMARKEGLLYIDSQLENIKDPFLRKGMQLVVDGTDPEMVRNILETEVYSAHGRHEVGVGIFETAGGYAPAMGIIGTIMGLVLVLTKVADPDELGPAIAVAFITTLYGVAFANLVFIPIATRLKNLSKQEITLQELQIEGILALQAGYNPRLIRERLNAFLKQSMREKAEDTKGR